jgi:hypothetical protein
VGAYRSLGGAPPKPGDSTALLRSAQAQLQRSLLALSSQLDATAGAGRESDAAADGRKVSAAVQQALDRLPPAAELDDHDGAARTLLAAAAEDTGWAWRIIQVPPTSPALTAAARVLADHAAGCCDQAVALLGAAPSGEPRDGA